MPKDKLRICVIGAGAAGLSSAWSLNRFDRFEVHVYEAAGHAGGVATTLAIPLNGGASGASVWINDQVQGGADSYRNTLHLFARFGFAFTPVTLRVSIGSGDAAWNNVTRTPFLERMRPEIKRFERILRAIDRAKAPFAFVPIDTLLTWGRFSPEFRSHMLYPLMSLFLGSGVKSAEVPATLVAQLFLDKDVRLFDFDSDTFLSSSPPMVAFPNLTDVYTKIAAELGGRVYLRRPVRAVTRSKDRVLVTDAQGNTDAFDQVIFACEAESALRLLASPSPLERLVLGSVDYDEVPFLTHADADFMRRSYGADPEDAVQYYVRNSPRDPAMIDMSFNLKRYQVHLADSAVDVFQTISPIERIDDKRVFLKRVTRHNSHTRKHLALTVPLWRFLQGRRRTWFCGAYTLFNVHEMAIVSGLAAADRLGAAYPFGDDARARKQFDMYSGLVYGKSRAIS